MIVGVYPAADDGCGAYRMRFPARAAQLAGADVRILQGLDCQWLDVARKPELADVIPPDVDVVVLQRPLARDLARVVPMLQAHGRAVVIEVDDDFLTVNPANPAWLQCHPRRDPDRNWTWLRYAIRHADLVTVSTPALARRYASDVDRVRVLRNCVPERYLSIRRTELHGIRRIGWPGSPNTHPGDLEVCRGAVAQAVERTGAVFVAVGGERTAEVLGIPPDRAAYQPWTTLAAYPAAVASLDVGIAPLADTSFNRGKSFLKPLEYSALGVPFVCSPSPEYVYLQAGILAHNPRNWQRGLVRLMQDAAYAAEQRERNRAIAAEWTYERHVHEWVEAWETAWERRMKASVRQARRAIK